MQVRREDVLAVAAALEVGNDHPIANAIVAHAQSVLAPELLPNLPGAPAPGQAGSDSVPSSPTGGKGASRHLEWVWPTTGVHVIHGACASCACSCSTFAQYYAGCVSV